MAFIRRAALAGVLLAAACALAAAEQFPLERVDVTDPDIALLMMSTSYCAPMQGSFPGLKGRPNDIGDGATYYMAVVSGEVFALAYQPKPQPLLYVDTDRDMDLADEEAHKALAPKPRPKSRGLFGILGGPPELPGVTFGPIAIRTEQGDQAEIRVMMQDFGPDMTLARLFPAYVLTGRITVGGRAYDVSFVDADYNGRSAEPFEPGKGYRCDMMSIDLNRDGKVMPVSVAGRQSEVFPVPKIISLDGRWYRLTIDPAAPALNVEEIEPEFGHLDLGDAWVDVELWSDSGIHTLRTGKAPWRLPAGTYSAVTLELWTRGEAGKEWRLSSARSPGDMEAFTIEPNATTSFRAGPPLTDRVTVTGGGGMVSIQLAVVGQAGEEYEVGASCGPDQQPAPQFRILDEAGNVLLSDKFEYG